MTIEVDITINTRGANGREYEVEGRRELSQIVMRALEHQLKLPDDWTSFVLVITNPNLEPTP